MMIGKGKEAERRRMYEHVFLAASTFRAGNREIGLTFSNNTNKRKKLDLFPTGISVTSLNFNGIYFVTGYVAGSKSMLVCFLF